MNGTRKILLLLAILFIVIQFIQPKRNVSEGLAEGDISKVYTLPDGLHETFINKCYDCHSNNTQYPWYFNVQPVGWWLAAHVHDGKEHLNFSEFKSYSAKKADHKLEEIDEVIEEDEMPLKSYTLFHANTKITAEERKTINTWVTSLRTIPH